MTQLFTIAIVLGFFSAGCQNTTPPAQPEQAPTKANDAATALQLQGVERIEVFFYPDSADRKKVQQMELTDTTLIAAITHNVLEDTIMQSECFHDVKMFFVRNGAVFKTVYGATTKDCNYLAYAINSQPYYTKLDSRSKAILDSLRNLSR